MTTQNEIKPAAPAEGLDGGRCAVDAGFGVPPEVAALALKARLAQAAQQMCGHDWEEDRPSQLETADPYVFGNILPPSPRFNGSSVCRICGERRACYWRSRLSVSRSTTGDYENRFVYHS